ncbi:hypothetical protein B0H13DRAFT_2066363 [Mycena leptocephala]|nr:hypothetical protein B0H13DRAFT_2066363 [Mycena leptocephala]
MADSISNAEMQSQLNVNAYFTLVSFTIVSYDFLLTFDDEVRAYWGTRLTWATLLFYINRYVSLLGNSIPVVENFWTTYNYDPQKVATCRTIQTCHQYFSILAQIFVAALLIMRTYALYGQSRMILIVTSGIALAAVVVGAVLFLSVGCASGSRLRLAWMGMLVFDIAIFVLTAARALILSREQRGGLFILLVRDGTNVMAASNCGNILSFFYAGPYTRGVATTFTNVTTLYERPISTVVEPYYPSNFALSHISTLDDGRIGDNDIPLDELHRQRGP